MSCPAHALAVSRRFLEWEDVDCIRALIRRLRTKRSIVVADIGAGSGTTALAVFAERGEGVSIVTVDISTDALFWAGKAIENIGRSVDWRSVQGDAATVGRELTLTFDILLLDTSHEYDATCDELDAWLPRLRGQKLVWCHDYRGYEGVQRAVDERVAEGRLSLLEVRGLGWAGRARW